MRSLKGSRYLAGTAYLDRVTSPGLQERLPASAGGCGFGADHSQTRSPPLRGPGSWLPPAAASAVSGALFDPVPEARSTRGQAKPTAGSVPSAVNSPRAWALRKLLVVVRSRAAFSDQRSRRQAVQELAVRQPKPAAQDGRRRRGQSRQLASARAKSTGGRAMSSRHRASSRRGGPRCAARATLRGVWIGGSHDLLVNPARLRLPALDQFADGLDRQIRSMLSAHEGAAVLRDAESEPRRGEIAVEDQQVPGLHTFQNVCE